MKQRTSQTLYSYWNDVRGERLAPARFDIEPSRIADILAETFILEQVDSRTYTFRLAGTRICDYFGSELRGRNFIDLAGHDDRATMEHALASITGQGSVGVFELAAHDPAGRIVDFEALVLPLVHDRSVISRYLGSVSPIDPPAWLGFERLDPQALLNHVLIWPDGRPHAVLERTNRQAPFQAEFANAKVVRLNRRQFRVLDGGRNQADSSE